MIRTLYVVKVDGIIFMRTTSEKVAQMQADMLDHNKYDVTIDKMEKFVADE